MEQATPLFKIGDVCVDRTASVSQVNLRVKLLKIRGFNSDGSKAIVFYVHCPAGMVLAVDVRLLNIVDEGVFLRPSPYTTAAHNKRRAEAGADEAGEKRTRKE